MSGSSKQNIISDIEIKNKLTVTRGEGRGEYGGNREYRGNREKGKEKEHE